MAEQLTNLQQLQLNKIIDEEKKKMESALIGYDKIAEITGFQKDMIGILHKSVAKGTTVSELAYFLSYCKGVGLNPLNKEIWCYKNNKEDVIIFTSRDGFLKKNKQNPLYRGMTHSAVMEFDEFELDMIAKTVIHKIPSNRGKVILGAYCIVKIEGQEDTLVWLDFSEFDLGQAKWKSSPKMMIDKCAQSAALKEASGMTGIQSEESFIIKNDVAYSSKEDREVREEVKIKKEDERLELLIANCMTIEALNKLMKECVTPDQIQLWEDKKNELEK